MGKLVVIWPTLLLYVIFGASAGVFTNY